MNPLAVHVYLTPLCNLTCTHCYYDALTTADDPGRILEVPEIVSTITWLCSRFDADLHLEGGEMFLRPDVEEILAGLPESCLSALTLTTSGTVPLNVSPDLLRKVGDLRISVEGHRDDIQSVMRPAKLARVRRTLDELCAADVPFTLRATLFRHNAEVIAEMLDAFASWGAQSLSFFEFQSSGRGIAHESEYMMSDGLFRLALDTFAATAPPAPIGTIKISLSPGREALARELLPQFEAQGYELRSFAGTPNLTINSNGDLGISPWEATAHKLNDRFANLRVVDFAAEVERQWRSGSLQKACKHTSSVQLRYVRRALADCHA